jgi:hypothetical protein
MKLRGLLSILVWFFVLGPVWGEEAETIIRRAIQAAGMPEDNKVYHESWTEKGKMTAMGQTFSYDAKWAFEAPVRFRFDLKSTIQGQAIELSFVQNGEKAKESAMGLTRAVEGEKLEETKHSAHQFTVCSLRPLLHDSGFKFVVREDGRFADKPVTSIKVSKAGQRDVTLHFDKKTHLLAGCSDVVKDEFQNWKEVPQETAFTDYQKSASGEMFFKKMVVKRAGKVLIESELSDYKRSPELKTGLFKLD